MFNLFRKKQAETSENKVETLDKQIVHIESKEEKQKDSWMPGANTMRKWNEEVWNTLTQEEIKEKVKSAAQSGQAYVTIFERKIKEEDKIELQSLGYQVNEGVNSGAPYVKIIW